MAVRRIRKVADQGGLKLYGHAEVREAVRWARLGGQALHVWDPGPDGYPGAPGVFQRSRPWAHLFDLDTQRLKKLVRSLGVRVVYVHGEGRIGQHVDLCAGPLRKAMDKCRA